MSAKRRRRPRCCCQLHGPAPPAEPMWCSLCPLHRSQSLFAALIGMVNHPVTDEPTG